jgi:hypothetical protein
MSIPNYRAFVEAAAADLKDAHKASQDGAFDVVNLACLRIRASGDLNCGVLLKTSGNRSRDRAVDILAFKEPDGTLTLVDCIGSSGDPSAVVRWSVADTRPDQTLWREPYPLELEPDPPDTPGLPGEPGSWPMPDAENWHKKLLALAEFDAALAQQVAGLEAALTEIRIQISAMTPCSCQPVTVQTGKTAWHTHTVTTCSGPQEVAK